MFRKSIALALVVAGTFGLTALSATAASALPGYHGPAKIAAAKVAAPRIAARVTPNRPGVVVHPRLPRPHWHVHVRYPRIWVAPRPVIVGAVTPLVTPVVSRCTCLTKEYTQDGLVVFQDVCTKELASAPIGNTQTQLQLPAQQAPTTQQ